MVLIYPEVNKMGCRAQRGEQGPQLVVCARAPGRENIRTWK